MIFSNKNTQEHLSQHATIISEGCDLTGDLTLNASIQIDGKLEGNIYCCQSVTISQLGQFKGTIRAKELIVKGQAHGNFYAEEIDILKSGTLNGTLYCDNLSIESGGRFLGEVKVADSANKSKTILPLEEVKGKLPSMNTAVRGSN